MREPEPLQQLDRTYVRYKGQKLSYFAGCDYFRLSWHPAVKNAAIDGLKKYGLSVSASRLTTGNHKVFSEVEKALTEFFNTPAALLVSNGYNTNAIAAQAMRDDFSHVLIDEKAHVSLQDAARQFNCPTIRFAHRNAADIRRRLPRGKSRVVLLTDGMFANDGCIAPLDEYLKVLPRNAMMLVDDAHAAGVLGGTGKGTLEQTDVPRHRIVQTLTLSKAFGSYGGAILCTPALREKMIQTSGMFAGSTPIPLPLANAAVTAIRLLKRDRTLRRRLCENVKFVKSALAPHHPTILQTPSPIIGLIPATADQAAATRKRLLARKVFPSFIQYPGGPPNGYFRFVISSEHTREQLVALTTSLIVGDEVTSL
jgi:7-keto-8-aminopelargonate synthetase-like enzyme